MKCDRLRFAPPTISRYRLTKIRQKPDFFDNFRRSLKSTKNPVSLSAIARNIKPDRPYYCISTKVDRTPPLKMRSPAKIGRGGFMKSLVLYRKPWRTRPYNNWVEIGAIARIQSNIISGKLTIIPVGAGSPTSLIKTINLLNPPPPNH